MRDNYSQWLTKKEAAQYLKLSVRSIENLVNRQLLKAYKLGGRVLLNMKEIDACVRAKCGSWNPIGNFDRL